MITAVTELSVQSFQLRSGLHMHVPWHTHRMHSPKWCMSCLGFKFVVLFESTLQKQPFHCAREFHEFIGVPMQSSAAEPSTVAAGRIVSFCGGWHNLSKAAYTLSIFCTFLS